CISDHNIGPKAYLIDESKKVFDEGFLILEFIEGKTLSSSQYKLNSRIIRNLAKLVAELHNIKPTISLKKDFVNPKDYLREIKEYRSQIKDLGAATIFLELFDETFNKLERKYQNITFPEITSLIHGDIQEQNILITKKGIRLIDFESLSISDPGTEISYIFLEFGKPWSKNQ
ncbi:MAG: phosphotransferase, partial [Nanoarchaeota archaeon]